MSTFIEVAPEESQDTQTTIVRIDDDLKISVRQMKGAARTDMHLNFSNMDVGDELATYPEPVASVRITKLGADNRATIVVKCYYLEGEAHTVPAAGVYWFDPSKQYNPELGDPGDGRTAGPDPVFEGTTQQFPVLIFAPDTITPTLPANTASALAVPTRYTQLATLPARRQHLRTALLQRINDARLPWILAGATLAPIAAKTTPVNLPQTGPNLRTTAETINITEERELARRQQSLSYWFETLARAISVDANLNTEAKFNLLDGEVGLDTGRVFARMPLTLAASIAGTRTRTDWQFHRFGSVAGTSPHAYIAPTHNTLWGVTRDTGIDIGSAVPAPVTENWINWLRGL